MRKENYDCEELAYGHRLADRTRDFLENQSLFYILYHHYFKWQVHKYWSTQRILCLYSNID